MYEHIYEAMMAIYLARETGLYAAALNRRTLTELDAAGWIRRHGDLVALHKDGLDALQSELEDRASVRTVGCAPVYRGGYSTPGVFEAGDYSPGDWNHDRVA